MFLLDDCVFSHGRTGTQFGGISLMPKDSRASPLRHSLQSYVNLRHGGFHDHSRVSPASTVVFVSSWATSFSFSFSFSIWSEKPAQVSCSWVYFSRYSTTKLQEMHTYHGYSTGI